MFYGDFGQESNFYELRNVVSGKEYIENTSGTIKIRIAE